MYDLIRQLSTEDQRELIGLLDPTVRLDRLSDDQVLAQLNATLRQVLQVPKDGDLRVWIRRRLVEVADRFKVVDDSDDYADAELAEELVEFALTAAAELAESDEERAEFATFLRTKKARERHEWLVDALELASRLNRTKFDRLDAEADAEELNKTLDTAAKTLVAGVGAATVASAASRALLAKAPSALAGPLGAVAGGLFMAGATKKRLAAGAAVTAAEVAAQRAKRARHSKMVQGLMATCAYVLVARDGLDEVR